MPAGGAESSLQVAENHLATGDYRRAEQVISSSLSISPNDPRLLTAYARAKLGLGDWTGAAASAHAALSADPGDEYTMRVYTRTLEMLGRWDEALSMAGRTVAANPSSFQAHYGLARLLHSTARQAEAMTAVNEALRLNPTDADSYVLRGDVFAALGQTDAAESDYRHVLQVDPYHADALHSMALLENSRGRRRNALRGLVGLSLLASSHRELVRQNVGGILTGVLRRSAWIVLIVAFAVVFAYTLGQDGHATAVARIIAGIGVVALAMTSGRALLVVPGGLLTSVLRHQQILAVRIVQALAAVMLGGWTAAFGAAAVPAVAASVLVLSLPIVVIVGGLTGERLW